MYLDSTLLDNLTEEERVEMIKLFIKEELGGQVFSATDSGGTIHNIKIADRTNFTNRSGNSTHAYHDLLYRTNKEFKQDAIANAEELILAATFVKKEDAIHPHDWLDDNGNNQWDLWKVHIQDKNNTIWTASLRIANTRNGEKICMIFGQ